MIVIQMSGGLGNQMFQYALYCKLRALGREVCFDDFTQYDEAAFAHSGQKRRPKFLNQFGITYPVVSREDLTRMTDSKMDPASRIRRKLKGRKSLEKRDQNFIYDHSFLEMEDGYFCGGFQSPKYFDGVEDVLREAFSFSALGKDLSASFARQMRADSGIRGVESDAAVESKGGTSGRTTRQDRNEQRVLEDTGRMRDRILAAGRHSTSIHLRFGDYLDKSEIYGGICTDAYYDEAVREILEEDPEAVFFVFSNDAEMAGNWIRVRAERPESIGHARFVLIKGRDEDHGFLDLYLMTLCQNHIIANSSFSWWGAWLCTAENKKIYAPSIWNNEKDGSELRHTDIYTTDMIRINPQGIRIDAEPLISVVVTAYNVAPYIRRAMDSVCGQTWRNLDIVAIDDGSTDGTGAILDETAGRDTRIRVFHTENRGVSAARNEGLRRAEGDYIGFVDGDDMAHPSMYEAMIRGMLISGADLSSINYLETVPESDGGNEGVSRVNDSSDDNRQQVRKGEQDDSIARMLQRSVSLSRTEAVRAFIHGGMEGTEAKVVLHPAVWSKLFSKRVLKGNSFPENTSAEDIPFTTRALCQAEKTLYFPDVLYDYTRERSDSIMNTARADRTLTQEIPAWHTHFEILKRNGLSELAEESEYYYYRRLLSYEEDYRSCSSTEKEAEELEKKILEKKDRILTLSREEKYGRRGDRERLKLYVQSPKAYYFLAKFYGATVVAWKNRKSK